MARAELLAMTVRARCRFGLLTKRPLVPNDSAARHGLGHSKLLCDSLIGEPFGAQLVGQRVEIGAALAASLPAHVPDGIRDPAAEKGDQRIGYQPQFTGAGYLKMLQP